MPDKDSLDDLFEAVDTEKRRAVAEAQQKADAERQLKDAERQSFNKNADAWAPVIRRYLDALGRRTFPDVERTDIDYSGFLRLRRKTHKHLRPGYSVFVKREYPILDCSVQGEHKNYQWEEFRLRLRFQNGQLFLGECALTEDALRTWVAEAYAKGPSRRASWDNK